MLLDALMNAPYDCSLREKDVGKDAEWTNIMADPFFLGADDGGSATLAHLVAIYVERSSSLWKVRAWKIPYGRMSTHTFQIQHGEQMQDPAVHDQPDTCLGTGAGIPRVAEATVPGYDQRGRRHQSQLAGDARVAVATLGGECLQPPACQQLL